MNDLAAELRDRWTKLAGGPGASTDWRAMRLAIDGPITCYAAIRNADGHQGIVLESPISDAPSSRVRFEAEGLRASERRDFGDGRYRVAVSLEQAGYGDMFGVVALDLLSVVTEAGAAAARWARLSDRLAAWQACLRARRRGLGREAQVGLYGELVCLGWLASHVGFPAALEGWRGPYHGVHDFVLERRAFEVKTATGDDRLMRIGSLDQLEEQGLPLAVLRPRLETARAGRTLAELVHEVRGEIAARAPSLSRHLEELLLRCGYLDLDAERYAERLELASFCGYRVDGALPRLRRPELNPAIADAEYQIDEGRLSGLRIEGPDLAALLGEGSDDH